MWSPTKVDTFFVTDASGTVKAWKYETMEQKCFYEKKLTSSPIVSMEMCSDGASAIVGDSKGRTMVLNLSENLCRKSQRDEKQFMNLMGGGCHVRKRQKKSVFLAIFRFTDVTELTLSDIF